MTDPKCSNCKINEVADVRRLCQTCDNAYTKGYSAGYQDGVEEAERDAEGWSF